MPDAAREPLRARKIDTHQHFWKYNAEEYPWISANMCKLRRDFLPSNLADELRAAGIDAAVSVQARQTLEETAWLLELADQHEFLAGVVGWAPLIEAGVEAAIERFASHPKLKGVRHVLQDEPDGDYMLRADFNQGIARLRAHALVYDILIFERHLPQTIQFVDRHPHQIFLLDHIAKPRIKDGSLSPWRSRMMELAKRENVWCKLSGMVT
ncbi:MAG: amidohydrolase family protein, partial [Bryobacteraceae bacterium]